MKHALKYSSGLSIRYQVTSQQSTFCLVVLWFVENSPRVMWSRNLWLPSTKRSGWKRLVFNFTTPETSVYKMCAQIYIIPAGLVAGVLWLSAARLCCPLFVKEPSSAALPLCRTSIFVPVIEILVQMTTSFCSIFEALQYVHALTSVFRLLCDSR